MAAVETTPSQRRDGAFKLGPRCGGGLSGFARYFFFESITFLKYVQLVSFGRVSSRSGGVL